MVLGAELIGFMSQGHLHLDDAFFIKLFESGTHGGSQFGNLFLQGLRSRVGVNSAFLYLQRLREDANLLFNAEQFLTHRIIIGNTSYLSGLNTCDISC